MIIQVILCSSTGGYRYKISSMKEELDDVGCEGTKLTLLAQKIEN